jgi:hypothetical protein
VAIGIPLTVMLGAAALNIVLGTPNPPLAQHLGTNGGAQGLNELLGIDLVLSLIPVLVLRLITQ